MSTSHRNRAPDLLSPYLALPPDASLTLLTSTLSCSATWLLARFATSALTLATEDSKSGNGSGVRVVLASWMRDASFWKDELRRAAALDPSRPPYSSSYTYLDLFTTQLSSPANDPLAHLEKTVLSALPTDPSTRTLLLLDDPSLLLALYPSLTPTSLSTTLLSLRAHPSVHSTVLCVPADKPFLSASPASTAETGMGATPLEAAMAAFVTEQAHGARCVMGVRMLESGAARDASGVLRVSRGGGWSGQEEGEGEEVRELERLYLVGRDGGVKIVE